MKNVCVELHHTSSILTRSDNASFPSCACNALRSPNATELQYNVSYASIDMAISSRIRSNSNPRSVQLMVTWRINSSACKINYLYGGFFFVGLHKPKHWLYKSRRTGQMPVSRACVCCSRVSSISCKLITSWRVAGTLDTVCVHSWPSSSQQRGGRMAFSTSSVSFRESVIGSVDGRPSFSCCGIYQQANSK